MNDDIWKLSGLGSSAVSSVPSVKNVLATYPNPFTRSTTIRYSSQQAGRVEVSIVNVLGAEVARIFSGEIAAGDHKFSWDAHGLAAGPYFCLVRSSAGVTHAALMLER